MAEIQIAGVNLSEYRAQKAKVENEALSVAATLVEEIQQKLSQLKELQELTAIELDLHSLVSQVNYMHNEDWSSSSMYC